jgi:trk system potassium uptake protein TrkA
MFDDLWGVDVAVSTPRLMCALVEEAVTVGDLVRLLSFRGGQANLVEMTLPETSPRVGVRVADLALPGDAVLVAIIRDGTARAPERDGAVEASDELLFVVDPQFEADLAHYLSPRDRDPVIVHA